MGRRARTACVACAALLLAGCGGAVYRGGDYLHEGAASARLACLEVRARVADRAPGVTELTLRAGNVCDAPVRAHFERLGATTPRAILPLSVAQETPLIDAWGVGGADVMVGIGERDTGPVCLDVGAVDGSAQRRAANVCVALAVPDDAAPPPRAPDCIPMSEIGRHPGSGLPLCEQ